MVIALVSAIALAAAPAFADPTVASKQAEAQSVLGQIQQLDSSLERAVEAYNLANIKLSRIKHDLSTNTHSLTVAKKSLKNAQKELSSRLVDLYTSDEGQDSGLAVLLGSSSLDDMLSRMDAVDRVSQQDSLVLRQVAHLRREVQRRQRELRHAHSEQVQVVAERDSARSSIQSQLGQRQALLGSIRGEIAHLQAQERERQAALQRQLASQVQAQQASASETALAQTVAPQPTTTIAPAPPSRYGGVVGIAMRYLGTPYVWGGASPGGFDCSGFVMYVFSQIGVSLPHNAAAQYGYGAPVSRDALQPGDLVFFDGLGHVGIYVGGGSFIHSPHTGDVVKVSSLSGWYSSTFVGARRL
ncbi:MAG TPA: NlpC/P60 family protein [Gaiellaceae bacterium]|nr:NlpC/P60 family protein [Gaiellaceae bacterium]